MRRRWFNICIKFPTLLFITTHWYTWTGYKTFNARLARAFFVLILFHSLIPFIITAFSIAHFRFRVLIHIMNDTNMQQNNKHGKITRKIIMLLLRQVDLCEFYSNMKCCCSCQFNVHWIFAVDGFSFSSFSVFFFLISCPLFIFFLLDALCLLLQSLSN